MNILSTIFAFIYIIVIHADDEYLSKKSVEKNLLQKLMKSYEFYGVNGRPVNDSRNKIIVNYGLALVQILGLDGNTQILRTNCWGRYKWHDELLKWDPNEYDGIDQIRLEKDYMWMPDIQLFNFADERMKVHREARVVVSYNGNILWVPQALFKSSCSVEISYFPFDVQICRLDFGSWTYDTSQLELHWYTLEDNGFPNDSLPYVDFKAYIHNNEWHADGEIERNTSHMDRTRQIRSLRFLRHQNITDGNEIIQKTFHVLRYRIRLRRNPSFYVFILIIPCVLLSLLVNIVFWLPTESPAKLLLGMNIFVAFFILLLLLKSSIPTAVRTFPLIGSFFCLNMIMITLSTFLVTIVINFYVRGDRKGPMPNYIRKIMIDNIGRLLFVSQFIPLPPPQPPNNCNVYISQSPARKIQHKLYVPELACNKFMATEIQNIEGTSTSQQLSNRNNKNKPYSTNVISSDNNENQKYSRNNGHRFISYTKPHSEINNFPNQGVSNSTDSPIMVCGGTSSIEKDVIEITRYVRKYIGKQKEAQRKNQLTMEWRTLGLVLDRLFCIFYIATIVVAVIIGIPTNADLMKMEVDPPEPNMILIE